MQQSEKARQEIYDTWITLKSIEFIEVKSGELLHKLDVLQERHEAETDFEQKEILLCEIEKCLPELRLLRHRCAVETKNLAKISKRPV